jgi:hypothetical protein
MVLLEQDQNIRKSHFYEKPRVQLPLLSIKVRLYSSCEYMLNMFRRIYFSAN